MGGCGGLEVTGFFTVSTSGKSGGFVRTDFEQLILWEGVVVLKELILTISTLRQCGTLKALIFNSFYVWRCGGLERTHFYHFYVGGVVVLKELIFNISYFSQVWWC